MFLFKNLTNFSNGKKGIYSKKYSKKQNKGKNYENTKTDDILAKSQKLEVKNSLIGQNSLSTFMNDKSALELNIGSRSGQKFFAKSEVTIYAWNVNGVRALIKKKKLSEFFETVNPEILCLSETKIDEDSLKIEKLQNKIPKGYLQYWNCCVPPIKGYAGTAVFTKIMPISVKYNIGVPKHDKEGRIITCEFEKFYLVAVYVPNSGSNLKWLDYRCNEWDIDFRNYLKSLELKGKPVILLGDLNVAPLDIDVYNPQGYEKYPCFTAEEKCSFAFLKNLGFIDTFREKYPGKIRFSFWDVRSNMRRENKGWRLDYALVSKSIYGSVVDSEIHTDIWGSDHCPISLTVDLSLIDIEEFKQDINCDDILDDEKSDMNFDDDEEEKINEFQYEHSEDFKLNEIINEDNLNNSEIQIKEDDIDKEIYSYETPSE